MKKYIQNNCTNVTIIKGYTSFLHGFGKEIGQCEIESQQLKSLKADIYVMCNTKFVLPMLSYIRHSIPLVRMSNDLWSKSLAENVNQNLNRQLLSGSYTYLTPDNLPLIGKSVRFTNLYFNLGCHDYKLDTYIRNAELIRDEIVKDLGSGTDFQTVPEIRPERFQI